MTKLSGSIVLFLEPERREACLINSVTRCRYTENKYGMNESLKGYCYTYYFTHMQTKGAWALCTAIGSALSLEVTGLKFPNSNWCSQHKATHGILFQTY